LAFSGHALYLPTMHLDFSKLPPREAYEWMTNTILPCPIAWVSTLSAEGKTNLAPFTFFHQFPEKLENQPPGFRPSLE
jgi:hypothetical protein